MHLPRGLGSQEQRLAPRVFPRRLAVLQAVPCPMYLPASSGVPWAGARLPLAWRAVASISGSTICRVHLSGMGSLTGPQGGQIQCLLLQVTSCGEPWEAEAWLALKCSKIPRPHAAP